MIKKIIGGEFFKILEKREIRNYVLFLFFLLVIYVGFHYYIENSYRKMIRLQEEVVELNEYNIEILIDKTNMLRFVNIREKVKNRGLKISQEIYKLDNE